MGGPARDYREMPVECLLTRHTHTHTQRERERERERGRQKNMLTVILGNLFEVAREKNKNLRLSENAS